MGLASGWSKEETFFYLDSAAMIGACSPLRCQAPSGLPTYGVYSS